MRALLPPPQSTPAAGFVWVAQQTAQVRSACLQFQGARRVYHPAADVDLSSMSVAVPGESPLVFLPACDSNLVPLSPHVPESRLHRRPQTSPFLSTSRTARTRTRKCRCADPPAVPS